MGAVVPFQQMPYPIMGCGHVVRSFLSSLCHSHQALQAPLVASRACDDGLFFSFLVVLFSFCLFLIMRFFFNGLLLLNGNYHL